MADKRVPNISQKNKADTQKFINPAISWGVLGGELALAIIIALIAWL